MTEGRVVVIARPGLGAGFALAGVRVHEASDGREAAARLRHLLEDERLGAAVVAIDDGLHAELPEDLRAELRHHALPVVVPIPGPRWSAESRADEYIVEILRRAIGYRVRLQ